MPTTITTGNATQAIFDFFRSEEVAITNNNITKIGAEYRANHGLSVTIEEITIPTLLTLRM